MTIPIISYTESYRSPNGPGDSRPTALQIIQDNQLLAKWKGRVAFVTGGTSGIGLETVRALHETGADVWFTARDASKGQSVRADIEKRGHGEGRLEVISMDLESLESVREGAKAFLNVSSRLDILVNNAGIMSPPYSKTKEGFELQMGVNHLAHHLLTTLLLPTLISSSSPKRSSRVINVSSTGHRLFPFYFDDYNPDKTELYNPLKSYAQSKTANAWSANYIDRVFGPQGVRAFSLHPGAVVTGIQAHTDPALMNHLLSDPAVSKTFLSWEQGAATTVWAAVSPELEGHGGKYLSECRIAGPAESLDAMSFDPGYAPFLYDPEAEEKLWELSEILVKEGNTA